MFVDASSAGIGFTLGQVQNGKEVVIAYNGRGLNQAGKNYSTTEREALALIEEIKKFQPYLHFIGGKGCIRMLSIGVSHVLSVL